MRDLSRVERWVGIAAGVVTIVGGLAALTTMNRGLLNSRRDAAPAPVPAITDNWETAPSGDSARTAAVDFTPSLADREAAPAKAATSTPARDQPSEFPVQALLREGDQRVMLGGYLGVGVAFSEVASTPIATLQINHEGSQELKPLQTSGDAFTVAVRSERYRISVVRLDFRARELQVRIDRLE